MTMTISESHTPVAWCAGIESTIDGWISAKAWKEGEFTTPLFLHPPREVTDAMVEQACTAYFAPNGEWPCFGVRSTEIYRRQMKAALVAALGEFT